MKRHEMAHVGEKNNLIVMKCLEKRAAAYCEGGSESYKRSKASFMKTFKEDGDLLILESSFWWQRACWILGKTDWRR